MADLDMLLARMNQMQADIDQLSARMDMISEEAEIEIGKAFGDERPRWPGDGFLAGYRWYDPDITTDTTGTEITDNSSGAKTWLVFDRLTNLVTYETGPRPNSMGETEWFNVATLVDSPHVSGL